MRAAFKAHSLASAPELAKKTRFAPVRKLGKVELRFGIVVIADVLDARELVDDRRFPLFVVRAEDVDGDARTEVDVAFSLRIEEGRALAALDGDGEARERFRHIGVFELL